MFSKACKYGLRAVLWLAACRPEGSRATVPEIAEGLQVPRHFLAKVLQQLSRAGLISSVKGPNGGFFLSPADRSRPVLDIVKALDGDVLEACVLGLERCSSKDPCPLHFQVYSLREGFRLQLAHQTVEVLAQSLNPDHLKSLDL